MEGAMELHKIDVHDNLIRKEGAFLWHNHGTLVVVGDQEYVELSHGSLVKRTPDWKTSEAEAYLDAAARVEAMGAALIAQAERIRAEEGSHATA